MGVGRQKDLGSQVHVLNAVVRDTGRDLNSGDTGAATGTVFNSPIFDQESYSRKYHSVVVSAGARGDLASGITFTLDGALRHSLSTDATGFSDYATGTVTSAAGATDGSTFTVDFKVQPVNFVGVNRYFRVQLNPTFSTTSSGSTVQWEGPFVILGGADRLPASG
jgi:hypothetical protein